MQSELSRKELHAVAGSAIPSGFPGLSRMGLASRPIRFPDHTRFGPQTSSSPIDFVLIAPKRMR